MSRKFGPKTESHPNSRKPCPVCHEDFKIGDYTGLIPLGPDDDENRKKAAEGKAYNAVAVEVHWDCMDPKYKEE